MVFYGLICTFCCCIINLCKAGQFDIDKDSSQCRPDYRDILKTLSSSEFFDQAYDKIDNCIDQLQESVDGWFSYQALWQIDISSLFCELENDDINRWFDVVQDMVKSRRQLDHGDLQRHFGPLILDTSEVIDSLKVKYDHWVHELLAKYSELLSGQVSTFFNNVSSSRLALENQHFGGAISDATAAVTTITDVKQRAKTWDADLDIMKTSLRMLERQRFAYLSKKKFTVPQKNSKIIFILDYNFILLIIIVFSLQKFDPG